MRSPGRPYSILPPRPISIRPIRPTYPASRRFFASQDPKESTTVSSQEKEVKEFASDSASTKSAEIPKSSPLSAPPSDWEDNPNYNISNFSELPHSNFGVNQHIVINDEFKEALRQILWQFRAPIRYAFAYGSGVFPQSKPVRPGLGLRFLPNIILIPKLLIMLLSTDCNNTLQCHLNSSECSISRSKGAEWHPEDDRFYIWRFLYPALAFLEPSSTSRPLFSSWISRIRRSISSTRQMGSGCIF